jgi:hypothetical protein
MQETIRLYASEALFVQGYHLARPFAQSTGHWAWGVYGDGCCGDELCCAGSNRRWKPRSAVSNERFRLALRVF